MQVKFLSSSKKPLASAALSVRPPQPVAMYSGPAQQSRSAAGLVHFRLHALDKGEEGIRVQLQL